MVESGTQTYRELSELDHVHAALEDGLHLWNVALSERRLLALGLLLQWMQRLSSRLEQRRLKLESVASKYVGLSQQKAGV